MIHRNRNNNLVKFSDNVRVLIRSLSTAVAVGAGCFPLLMHNIVQYIRDTTKRATADHTMDVPGDPRGGRKLPITRSSL